MSDLTERVAVQVLRAINAPNDFAYERVRTAREAAEAIIPLVEAAVQATTRHASERLARPQSKSVFTVPYRRER